jgi:acyl carrier protein phosphodiesterase
LVADWIEASDLPQLSSEVLRGIELHRAIDHFTDHHPAVREMNTILRPTLRKYSPVGSDLIIDFLIAHHWYLFHNCSYSSFCSDIYIQINESKEEFSPIIHDRLNRICRHRWLDRKQDSESWKYTLLNMDKRARFPSNFMGVQKLLLEKFSLFNSLFISVYSEATQLFPSEYQRKIR